MTGNKPEKFSQNVFNSPLNDGLETYQPKIIGNKNVCGSTNGRKVIYGLFASKEKESTGGALSPLVVKRQISVICKRPPEKVESRWWCRQRNT